VSKYFPPFRGGKYVGQPPLGWGFPAAVTCGFITMRETNNKLEEALRELRETRCANGHCRKPNCRGECDWDYQFRVLKVIKEELDEMKGAGKPLRPQKGVL